MEQTSYNRNGHPGISQGKSAGELLEDREGLKDELAGKQDDYLLLLQRGYSRAGKVFRPAHVVVNDLSHFSEN